jgi:alpha-methylacyl-CoA racemase
LNLYVMAGPLIGIKIIEIAGIGPGPFAGMMLADMGADLIQVERPGIMRLGGGTILDRGRRSIAVDLKNPGGPEVVLRLVEGADALIEGFRPGVCERLGIGPEACLTRNPRLVYGRMTGWGQDGPLAPAPGHDIDYIAVAGVLHAIGSHGGPPVPPLNLLGDFAGGGMMLAYGVVCALLERGRSGVGQIVDAAIVEGAAIIAAMIHPYAGRGWNEERGTNMLDGGAHFYNVYECADGRHVAVGAIEPQFYAALVKGLGLDAEDLPEQMDPATWPALRERFAGMFVTKPRDEWCSMLEGTDALVAPVLTMTESHAHPHNVSRRVFDAEGNPQPAPRLSRTPGAPGIPPLAPGADTDSVLAGFGFDAEEIERLRSSGAVT